MFSAVCDNCGKDCEVPFRPSTEKPIYCSKCFEDIAPRRDDSRRDGRSSGGNRDTSFRPRNNSSDISQLKDQLSGISAKLDTIIRLLTPVETAVVVVKEEKKPKKVTKKTTPKAKKTSTKKKNVT